MAGTGSLDSGCGAGLGKKCLIWRQFLLRALQHEWRCLHGPAHGHRHPFGRIHQRVIRTIGQAQTVGSADSIVTIFAGDLNGDGLDDAVGGADSLFWWENPDDPNQEWQKRFIEKIYLAGGVVTDYDGDGNNDIICMQNDYVNWSANLLLYKNLGNGLAWDKSVLYVHDEYGGFTGPEITSAYITGDGYLSVAVMLSQSPASMINVLRDGPSGWYAYKVVSPPCINTYRVFPSFVDLDTDGTADLMAGGQSDDYGRIRWYKGPEFYPYYNL